MIAYYVGCALLLKIALGLLFMLRQYCLKSVDLKKYHRADTWALITGGSDGIGLAMAKVLAE